MQPASQNPYTLSSRSLDKDETIPLNQPLRVMIVDDHEVFRNGLRDLINSIEGFRVVAQAGSCQEAFEQVGKQPIDLVVLDLFLPDGDGIEATRQLLRHIPQPKVIILSAIMYDEALIGAMLAGAHGYLTKDLSASDILKVLQGILRGEPAMLPTVAANLIHLLVEKYHHMEAVLATYAQNGSMVIAEGPTSSNGFRQHAPSAAQPAATPLQLLTPQESKVFQLMRQGQSNKQIAARLSISPYTVGKHIQNILRKLGVANRTQAASYTPFEGDNEPPG